MERSAIKDTADSRKLLQIKKLMFGICNLAIVPLRAEASDRSEIVSQVLFGEHFEVLETAKQWTRIKLQYDGYEGWIDTKQFRQITKEQYAQLSEDAIVLNSD